jgi:hypothetical protein
VYVTVVFASGPVANPHGAQVMVTAKPVVVNGIIVVGPRTLGMRDAVNAKLVGIRLTKHDDVVDGTVIGRSTNALNEHGRPVPGVGDGPVPEHGPRVMAKSTPAAWTNRMSSPLSSPLEVDFR